MAASEFKLDHSVFDSVELFFDIVKLTSATKLVVVPHVSLSFVVIVRGRYRFRPGATYRATLRQKYEQVNGM